MARIRTIKPDFWTDEKLTECSMSARLLFIGMFNFADDNGNLPASAKKLKMQIFPADSLDCQPLLNELIAHGVIMEYSVSGDKYLNICGFKKHQVINRPSSTSIPEPSNEDSVSAHVELPDGREGKGKEGKGIKEKEIKETASPSAPPAKPKSNGSRLPDNFQVPDDWMDWAASERRDIPTSELPGIAAGFTDYWTAKAGAAARKVSWEATWRNWIRNQKRSSAPPANRPQKFDPLGHINQNRVRDHDIIDI